MISDEERKYMSKLGKKSATKRKKMGFDYAALARKRWATKKR